jgi:hypothetical protein
MNHPPAHNTITVRLSDDLRTAVDDYRVANRIFKRADALRRLIEAGLNLDKMLKGGQQ